MSAKISSPHNFKEQDKIKVNAYIFNNISIKKVNQALKMHHNNKNKILLLIFKLTKYKIKIKEKYYLNHYKINLINKIKFKIL